MVIYQLEGCSDDQLIDLMLKQKGEEVQLHHLKRASHANLLQTDLFWKTVIITTHAEIERGTIQNLCKNKSWETVHFTRCENLNPKSLKAIVENKYWKNVYFSESPLSMECCDEIKENTTWFLADFYDCNLDEQNILKLMKNKTWKIINLTGNCKLSKETVVRLIDKSLNEQIWWRTYIDCVDFELRLTDKEEFIFSMMNCFNRGPLNPVTWIPQSYMY